MTDGVLVFEGEQRVAKRWVEVAIVLQHGPDWIELVVEDNGRGFDQEGAASRPATEGGFGLFSIRERLALLGAELDISSSANGTRIRIHAPT